jgi:hypothetical protein
MTDRYEELRTAKAAREPGIKCAECGSFIGYREIDASEARHHFEPLSEFGPEVSEWICGRCIRAGVTP